MKRYIKASVNEEYGNRLLKAYRDDLRFLARCESFDEFLSEGLHTANEQTIVNSWRRKHPDKADDFDEFSTMLNSGSLRTGSIQSKA